MPRLFGGRYRPHVCPLDGRIRTVYLAVSMAAVGIIFGIIILLIAAFFVLGWIVPLIIGLVRRKQGKSCTALIVLGSVWGVMALLGAGVIGLGVYAFSMAESRWQTEEFDPSAYEGETAILETAHKGNATLVARVGEGESYSFSTDDGSFLVPADVIKPQSYSITAKGDDGKTWTASWWFYSAQNDPEADLTAVDRGNLDVGPPIIVKPSRRVLSEGRQSIDVSFTDAAGRSVRLSPPKPPVIQILDASGAAVWSHKMEYG